MVGGRMELRLAVSLAGLVDPRSTPGGPHRTVRDAVDWAAQAGFRGVTLDGTAPGVRPRELDRSARRDLAASMRRVGLASAGVDLWIPPEHLDDARHADRAVAAAISAMELAGDLAALTEGQRTLSITLPRSTTGPATWRHTLEDEAQRLGVRIADCAWPTAADVDPTGPIGIGIDPALVLGAGEDPARAVSRAAAALVSVRVSDWNGVARVPVGRGRLDTLAFAVGVATAGYTGFAVADLRGTPDPLAAADAAVDVFGVRPERE